MGLIYYGESQKAYVPQQLKILHTRVFGQATVIATLLRIMLVKELMDRSGRYITDDEIEASIEEMKIIQFSKSTFPLHQSCFIFYTRMLIYSFHIVT